MSATSTSAARGARRSRPLSPWAMFFRGFLKHPVMVGSIVPSSDRLIRKMLDRVDWDTTKVFVEYGPGVGTFCDAILERMAPDAQFIAIDTNEDFVDYLRHHFRDPRFSAVQGSAADVVDIVADHGHDNADFVLSGLPFSTLPPGMGARISAETAKVIRPGGAFLVYQFSPKVKDFLTPEFDRIDHDMEWWNVPPAQLYWAWKD
ncbi:class I SAM-dependent methyltransferase [Stakelama saccharophila]|uniref:Methyltransferase domain-containing protein n=1 Tax=Stakelama saccharophila TaxID=3075605 RepID=A0ABZ0B9U5_9SPHN|nr:methyltransferase domain-containing protein [Stakelama sp. W311]WNO53987.1 methyltransferase domain-containing protein [Stakelama sp. W311]